ncbi:MAG: repeat containing protein, partial [Clostridiales bacterium]|nr:repeat containing protein [Clostridiales bacterium]
IKTSFVDVNADPEGFINVLDTTRGRIFQYDQDGRLIAIFGGKSNQVGTFNSPVAIDNLNGEILVLDDKRGDVTIFRLTEYGQLIHKAVKLYNEGLYEESMEPWKEVLKRDNKLEIAYIGIGKAQLKKGNYKEAMRDFKFGYDVKDYSKAYGLYMSLVVRNNIGVIAAVLVLLYVSVKLFKKRNKLKRIISRAKKSKDKENLYGAG